MCGLCGVLGADHWTDMASRPEVFNEAGGRRRRERLRRAKLATAVLRHYGLRLDDWQGRLFRLSGATGKAALVDDLTALWPAAQAMIGRPLDPLDPALIAALERVSITSNQPARPPGHPQRTMTLGGRVGARAGDDSD